MARKKAITSGGSQPSSGDPWDFGGFGGFDDSTISGVESSPQPTIIKGSTATKARNVASKAQSVAPKSGGYFWRWGQGWKNYFSDTKMQSRFLRLFMAYAGVTGFENVDDYFLPIIGQMDGGVSVGALAIFSLKMLTDVSKHRPPKR